MTGTSAPSGLWLTDFGGVTYTEITSLTDSDLTPSQFSSLDYSYQEGTAVNLQLLPAGATWTQTVSISPTGSGMVYNTSNRLLQGTLNDVTTDTTYTVTVTRANSYGSSVGTFDVQATDVAPVQTNGTSWNKALDFSGSNEHAKQVGNYYTVSPFRMSDFATNIAPPTTAGETAYGSSVRPWATCVVFKADLNSSTQHIWNQGEGASTGDDNIYLKLDSQGQLQFNWGRVNAGSLNQCTVASGIQSNTWYGVYIAHNGTRLSATDATASNLAAAFDIRLMSSGDSFASLGTNLSTSGNWTSTGGRMDRSYTGDFTVGGRGSNRNFHGEVASMVVTTLRIGQPMPADAEIEAMVTDPTSWVNDYKVGNSWRKAHEAGDVGGFAIGTEDCGRATQVWLMGDGSKDSYANGIRNEVRPDD